MSKIEKEKKANDKITKKWNNEIAKANGMMIKVPDEFLEKTRKFNKLHKDIQEEGKKFDEKAEEFKHANQNFWYELKKLLVKNGLKPSGDVEMGMNSEAVEDGIFIVNIMPIPQGGRGHGPMMM